MYMCMDVIYFKSIRMGQNITEISTESVINKSRSRTKFYNAICRLFKGYLKTIVKVLSWIYFFWFKHDGAIVIKFMIYVSRR